MLCSVLANLVSKFDFLCGYQIATIILVLLGRWWCNWWATGTAGWWQARNCSKATRRIREADDTAIRLLQVLQSSRV